MGHNLKIAWNLMRIHSLAPKQEYVEFAKKIANVMPGIGGDQLRCGWYDVMEPVAFYNAFFLDHDSNGVYFNVLATGIPYLMGTERLKGSHSMSGYHSTELCYLSAVDSNLLVTKQPLDLHFKPKPGAFGDNVLRVSPDILPPGSIKIEEVWIDGARWTDFDAEKPTVNLPKSDTDLRVKVRVAPAALADTFTATTEIDGDTATVTLYGDLDRSALGELQHELAKVVAAQPKTLVVDNTDLQSICGEGMRAFIFAKQKMDIDLDVVVVGATGEVRQAFDDDELSDRVTFGLIGGLVALRLRLPPIVGFLLAGILLSPYTPFYVADVHTAEQLGEIGVAFLMFGVGMHFSVKDLMAVKSIALPGAIVQRVLATGLTIVATTMFGWSLGAGIVLGLALSVASTVVLVRALMDRGLLASDAGKIAVGWLVVEDLFSALVLVLLPVLAVSLGGSVAARPEHQTIFDAMFDKTDSVLACSVRQVGVMETVPVLVGITILNLAILNDSRRMRLLAARARVPTLIWGVLIGGGVVTVLFTYFFGLKNQRA